MEVYEIQSGLGKLPVEWKENISKIEGAEIVGAFISCCKEKLMGNLRLFFLLSTPLQMFN